MTPNRPALVLAASLILPATAAKTGHDDLCGPQPGRAYTIGVEITDGEGRADPSLQRTEHCGDAVFKVAPAEGWEVESITGNTCAPANQGGGLWTAETIVENCEVRVRFTRPPPRAVSGSARETGG